VFGGHKFLKYFWYFPYMLIFWIIFTDINSTIFFGFLASNFPSYLYEIARVTSNSM
jgi:hypothetical protein